jgi:hypothetical protein
MATAEEMAQHVDYLLRIQGAVPYIERRARQPAQPGYVVQVQLSGATVGIAVRHLPPSDDALRQVEAYRRVLERELPALGLHLMTVVGASDYKLLIAWYDTFSEHPRRAPG